MEQNIPPQPLPAADQLALKLAPAPPPRRPQMRVEQTPSGAQETVGTAWETLHKLVVATFQRTQVDTLHRQDWAIARTADHVGVAYKEP